MKNQVYGKDGVIYAYNKAGLPYCLEKIHGRKDVPSIRILLSIPKQKPNSTCKLCEALKKAGE